jgi:hypothetical protein
MVSNTYLRNEPCTRCGERVRVVEMSSDSVGGGRAFRRAPTVAVQHMIRRVGGLSDPADEGSTRVIGSS